MNPIEPGLIHRIDAEKSFHRGDRLAKVSRVAYQRRSETEVGTDRKAVSVFGLHESSAPTTRQPAGNHVVRLFAFGKHDSISNQEYFARSSFNWRSVVAGQTFLSVMTAFFNAE